MAGRHRFRARLKGSIPAALLVALATGCPNSASTKPGAGAVPSAKSPKQEAEERCATVIRSVHETFQLQRLGQITDLADGVQRLNDWNQSCGRATSGGELPVPIRALLTDEQRDIIRGPRFTDRDGEHLRDCVLFRKISQYAFGEQSAAESSELARVTAAFQHVVLAVELVTEHPQNLPLTPYEICILGKGTAADRAWIFASLLRQVKVDSVLIGPSEPAGRTAKPAGPFLVGAIVDRQIYLFDPRLGVPIPPPAVDGRAPASPAVATLEQAVADPAVLKQLDAGEKHVYPIEAGALAQPAVWLFGDASWWSDRMRLLQDQFSGEQSITISDPLQETDLGSGLWTRAGEAGGSRWSKETLGIWSYPEEQLAARRKLTDDQKSKRDVVLAPFEAYKTATTKPKEPNRRSTDPKDQVLIFVDDEAVADPAAGGFDPGQHVGMRKTVGSQMRARLAHLAGDFPRALLGYNDVWKHSGTLIRNVERWLIAGGAIRTPQAAEILQAHERAMDDASFWIALCKFDQREYRVAAQSCRRYRTLHPKGVWMRQCRYLMALSLAAQEEYVAAIEELEEFEADDPEYAGFRWLIRQWKSSAGRGKPAESAH